MKRVSVKIHGRVQGVFFRANTQQQAQKLGVKGWVKNNKDGTVSAVFEGEDAAVDQIVNWCKQGPKADLVDNVEVSEELFTGAFEKFEIQYF